MFLYVFDPVLVISPLFSFGLSVEAGRGFRRAVRGEDGGGRGFGGFRWKQKPVTRTSRLSFSFLRLPQAATGGSRCFSGNPLPTVTDKKLSFCRSSMLRSRPWADLSVISRWSAGWPLLVVSAAGLSLGGLWAGSLFRVIFVFSNECHLITSNLLLFCFSLRLRKSVLRPLGLQHHEMPHGERH